MASESEYERLYQLWVQQNTINGGTVTLDGANTPAQYYDEASSLTLTPQQLAELQARQAHYNRTQALQTISSEIGANNFTNPYNARSTTSIDKLNTFSSSQGVLNVIALSAILNGSDALALGGSAIVIAALSDALGVDFEKLLLTAGLAGIGITMFNNLQSHTNSQTVNLPDTLENASQLAGMNAQFGEGPSSCSLFNELMGILAGAFDGAFDFIDAAMDKVSGIINEVAGALGDIVAGITGAIAGGIDAIISAISGLIPQGLKDLFNEIGDIASGLMGAFSDIANQITSEIANALEMANQIAQKLAALAMAAAMLDPCKLAVLMNTGSPELKSAANAMTSPVTNVIEEVQTELDPRANPEEVTRAVENAKAEAETAPGVPQSPFSEAEKKYIQVLMHTYIQIALEVYLKLLQVCLVQKKSSKAPQLKQVLRLLSYQKQVLIVMLEKNKKWRLRNKISGNLKHMIHGNKNTLLILCLQKHNISVWLINLKEHYRMVSSEIQV